MGRILTIAGMIMLLIFGLRTLAHDNNTVSESALNAYRSDISSLKARLESALKRLEHKSFDAELFAHGMMRLIDVELEIVDHLIEGKSGIALDRLFGKRNSIITSSPPSILNAYNMLLNYATAESVYVCKLRKMINQEKRAWTVLYASSRHHFLENMADIFDTYYALIKGHVHYTA